MFPESRVIKKDALAALKDNWGTVIAVNMMVVFFIFALLFIGDAIGRIIMPSFVNIIICFFGALVLIMVCIPVLLGIIRFFWHLYNESRTDINDVFAYFSSRKMYFRAFNLTLQLLSKILLVALVMYLPSIIVWLASSQFVRSMFSATPIWMANLWIIADFLQSIGFVLTVMVTLKYYLAPFIFVINDTVEPIEVLHLSGKAARLSVWNFLGLICTTFGWLLLTLLFVPAFFTIPYLGMCYVVHSRFAVYSYNEWLNTEKM